MRRPSISLIASGWLLVAMVALAADAGAQTLSSTATATFTVHSSNKLTLSAGALTFPDADPDTVPQIASAEGPLTITAKGRAGVSGTLVLTVQALDDFRSGMDVIPVSALNWTATGAGFIGGTMSKSSAQTVAQWTSGGTFTGAQNYLFRNSWQYSTGNYSVTLAYTLVAP